MIVLNDALQAVNLVAIEKSRFQGGRLEMKGQFALWREILAGVFDRIWPNRDASAEQAARHGLRANNLSASRKLARDGKLVLPAENS